VVDGSWPPAPVFFAVPSDRISNRSGRTTVQVRPANVGPGGPMRETSSFVSRLLGRDASSQRVVLSPAPM